MGLINQKNRRFHVNNPITRPKFANSINLKGESIIIMVSEITIDDLLLINLPIIDVRSPGEFEHGHIPGAISIPLFTNEERAHVGTVYKQNSKEAAVALGYKYVNPKLESYISESKKVAPSGKVIVHCWRGGMRSESFAEHLSDNGFQHVHRLVGGYKAYRNYILTSFEHPFCLKVLGGYTGSGKTHILHEMQNIGIQVIDLEGLAHHKGSAFGGIGQGQQPTVEQFENILYHELEKLDKTKPIWIEDESITIGAVKIPKPFFDQMREAKLFFIDIPAKERVKLLVDEYASCDCEQLSASIHRIAKRLGGLNEKRAIESLEGKRFDEVASIALDYYDKSYLKGMSGRLPERVVRIEIPTINHIENAKTVAKL